ncbi:MAG: hypothetical protein NTZ85_00950 [Bacteroidia bacterium]|nr:hypothetical protein [Bacteroidia bacterium]
MKSLTFKIFTSVFLIIMITFLYQCEKDNFLHEYRDIYGNWTIRNISGGFTGGSIEPNFDILTISHRMRYYIYRNDTLLSNGSIEIINETSDYLEIDFVSDDNFSGFIKGSKIVRLSNDTLVLSDNCADCYSAYFVRSETYSNENYIQPRKRLDFLEVSNYPIGFNKYCTSVYFQTELLGFITCFDGSILKTSDGGKTWKLVETTNTLPLYAISFINDVIGFAVGGQSNCGGTGCIVPGYLMLKTTDGGETWETVPLPYKMADLSSIRFYHSNFGIAIGTGAKLKTSNGGQTWSSFASDNMTAVYNIFLLNDNVAFLSGLKGQLFKTTDAGETWKYIGLKTDYYIQGVMFINEQVGYISLYNSLMKTTDGGLTWKRMEYAPVGVRTMYFSSETNGVAFGSRTYASSEWDVWDSYFNIMIDGKWYGDERVTSHCTPFCLSPKIYYTITYDNKVSIIKLTN